jgi:hypothetical protein
MQVTGAFRGASKGEKVRQRLLLRMRGVVARIPFILRATEVADAPMASFLAKLGDQRLLRRRSRWLPRAMPRSADGPCYHRPDVINFRTP